MAQIRPKIGLFRSKKCWKFEFSAKFNIKKWISRYKCWNFIIATWYYRDIIVCQKYRASPEDLELIDSFIQILGKDFRKYQKQFQHKSARSKKNYEALICIEMCSNFADDQVFEDSCEINIEVNEFSKTNSGLPYDGIRNCELTSNSTVFLCTGWFCKNTAQTIWNKLFQLEMTSKSEIFRKPPVQKIISMVSRFQMIMTSTKQSWKIKKSIFTSFQTANQPFH